MNIYLTRHGQTDWNKMGKIQGSSNINLNDLGIEQAKKVADILKDENFDLIICSPLKRSIDTANYINEKLELPILIDDRIMERDFGDLEGVISTSFDFDSYWVYNKNISDNNVESIKDFFGRVADFLDEIKLLYKDKNILLVAHGGVSIATKCYFSDFDKNSSLLSLCIDNCEVLKYFDVESR